jgi:hypothetical protein
MDASLSVSPRLRGEASAFAFWRAVRAEARATWLGRFAALWLLLGAAQTAWVALAPATDLGRQPEGPFWAVCALACWVPAWLGADLLSLKYRRNPDPLREPAPVEFLARAAGRLLPFMVVELVWVGMLTGRSLIGQIAAPPPVLAVDAAQFPSAWLAWTVVIIASGMPYAAFAAWLSGTARRPRQWLIAPFVVVFGSLTLVWVLELSNRAAGGSGSGFLPPPDQYHWFVLLPNYWVGVGYSLTLLGAAANNLMPGVQWGFSAVCWVATVLFLAASVPPALAVRAVARRRFKRHPNTAGTGGVVG